MSAVTPEIDVLAVARLSPLLAAAAGRRLHRCTTACTRPTRRRLRPSRRTSAASPPAANRKVGAELIAQLPALEIISVMGVGYDGIDVAAAKARGVVVTHTPERAERRRRRPRHRPDAVRGAPVARGRPLRARRRLGGQGPDAAGAQDVGRAAGPRRHGAHRPGHRAPRRGLRHADRLHRAQRQGRSCRTATSRPPRRWPPRATSSSSSRPAAPARAS